ncbi:MAG: RluA family pseudouridine synthase, partial [Pyrinomonadaceae bacterium]
IEGRVPRPAYKLRERDKIEIELSSISAPASLLPENIPLNILFEDDYLIVIDKPAGLVVHPGAGTSSGTLANALLYHFESIAAHLDARDAKDASETSVSLRPGIVHRLDRFTSGLIVVAKTEGALDALGEQFRQRKVFKQYLTLVHGQLSQGTEGSIDLAIGRDPHHRTRMGVPIVSRIEAREKLKVKRSVFGRPALSIYRVRGSYDRFSLLEVEIKTGRTHQIRVHLAAINHGVVGDELYNNGRDKTVPSAKIRAAIKHLGRYFLHSHRLRFIHPLHGEYIEFTSPLPEELDRFLKIIKE